jgi:hypothetical protein
MSNKMNQAAKQPELIDQFDKIEVKLTDVDNQLLTATEKRKAMLINNIATMFAEQLNHMVAHLAKKKNLQFNEQLFAGVFYDAPKGKAYILQYKSIDDATAARSKQ